MASFFIKDNNCCKLKENAKLNVKINDNTGAINIEKRVVLKELTGQVTTLRIRDYNIGIILINGELNNNE